MKYLLIYLALGACIGIFLFVKYYILAKIDKENQIKRFREGKLTTLDKIEFLNRVNWLIVRGASTEETKSFFLNGKLPKTFGYIFTFIASSEYKVIQVNDLFDNNFKELLSYFPYTCNRYLDLYNLNTQDEEVKDNILKALYSFLLKLENEHSLNEEE